uniref:dihydropteroate synthase n=1 Tax=candidate division WOR-3 bacterium TaxID=2052148 RepID=A0A7C4X8S2_UNCW3
MRVVQIPRKELLLKELQEIGVDPNAIPIFQNKAEYLTIKLEGLSPAQANILKQTSLICGADTAIPKGAYGGDKRKKFTVLLFANKREIEKIITRLTEQPGMEKIKDCLFEFITEKDLPVLKLNGDEIKFHRTYIMGIINISPDSFYSGSRYTTSSTVKKVIEEMEKEGADFIDIGAESTRPGAEMVTEEEELRRLKAILPVAMKTARIPISVDTYKPAVAEFAIDQGVKIINDISGLGFNKMMAKIIAKNRVGVVVMHIKGTPKTMQINPQYKNLMDEIHNYLKARIQFAIDCGIERERIIIDPGLGFGKRLEDNYEIIERLGELKIFNRPILVGPSRKSFIGKPFGLEPEERLEGTLAVEALLIKNGASILRVHDVAEAKKVALLIDRITK